MADLVTDISAFLNAPSPAACRALAARGPSVIPAGLASIVTRLHRMVMAFGDEMIQMLGAQDLANWVDVIVACGSSGSSQVLATLGHPDADVRALAAIELMSQELRSLPARQPLTQAFQRARGTGLRIALAGALAAQGDLSPLKSLTVPYLLTRERLEMLMQTTQGFRSSMSTQEKEETIYRGFAAPRVILLVIMDIASSGKMPRYEWPEWVRES